MCFELDLKHLRKDQAWAWWLESVKELALPSLQLHLYSKVASFLT
jgi:hypothetical protein